MYDAFICTSCTRTYTEYPHPVTASQATNITKVRLCARLEAHPACQSLSLHSFLMLPMQRVTRLPLLVDAVLKHLAPNDPDYQSCMLALQTLNNVRIHIC